MLFSNYSWTRNPEDMTVDEWDHVKHFVTPYTGIFINLLIYMFMTFTMSIIASTLPVPTGALIPAFKIGAGLGRFLGEAMHVWFGSKIIPGGYATVGAAAFTGAVTHTLSISVIVFEMTGQITHTIPMLISVLIANAFAALLSPSCYNSVIMIKKLPYLPDILPSSSDAYDLVVKDFMVSDIKYICQGMTYGEVRALLRKHMGFKGFPLVDHPESMILLGSVKRTELISAIERQICKERRVAAVAERRRKEEFRRLEREQKELTEQLQLRLQPQAEPAENRPSRFEVTKEDGSTFVPPAETIEEEEDDMDEISERNQDTTKTEGEKRKKLSLLSRPPFLTSVSLTHQGSGGRKRAMTGGGGGGGTGPSSPYNTVTGGMEKLQSIFKRPRSGTASAASPSRAGGGGRDGGVELPVDMPLSEQREWEEEQMLEAMDFESIRIDPAPFQLVEKTSLLKVHELFSMLGLERAYVTAIGRLIGVVGLKELRKSIEDANTGHSAALQEAKRQKEEMKKKQSLAEEDDEVDEEKGEEPPAVTISADSDADEIKASE